MAEATADLKKSMIEKALCQPNWIRVIEVELITRLGTNITRIQHIFKPTFVLCQFHMRLDKYCLFRHFSNLPILELYAHEVWPASGPSRTDNPLLNGRSQDFIFERASYLSSHQNLWMFVFHPTLPHMTFSQSTQCQ